MLPTVSDPTSDLGPADPLNDRPHSRKRRPRQMRSASASASRKFGRSSRIPWTRKLQARRSPSAPSTVPKADAERARRVHLDALAIAHALEDRPAHEDRLERALVGKAPVDEVDLAQLGDGVVRVADLDTAGEPLGQITKHEHQRERVGLVARDANEARGAEVVALRVVAQLRGPRLLEEELAEEIGRGGVGQPGELVAPFAAADQLGKAFLQRLPVVSCRRRAGERG